MLDEPNDGRGSNVCVTPRYLAGGGSRDTALAPLAGWPRFRLSVGYCKLLVTSPDHCIRIGWSDAGEDRWRVTAAEDAVSPALWTATFTQHMPSEVVAAVTGVLAREWNTDDDPLFHPPPVTSSHGLGPLRAAGWKERGEDRDIVDLLAPDGQAGAWADPRSQLYRREDETLTLWAGPKGRFTRAEARFTPHVPNHLVAAAAAALADPAPLRRARHTLRHEVAHLVRLEPLEAQARLRSAPPTTRAEAARIRTASAPPHPGQTATPPPRAGGEAPTTRTTRPQR
ncbi:DUF317 domain-containing protein [Streptomyces sp. NPDC054796]